MCPVGACVWYSRVRLCRYRQAGGVSCRSQGLGTYLTIISSFPYITTSTPLSPLSANDIEPSKPPSIPSSISHVSANFSSLPPPPLAPCPFIPGRPTPPQQHDIDMYIDSTWLGDNPLRYPYCVVPQSRNVLGVELPFVPADPNIDAHIIQSATACPRPPAQGGPARGYSICHHQHGQQAEHDIPPRHLDPLQASPTLPPHVHPPGSRLLEKPSPTEYFHARRDQWLSRSDCLFGISSTKSFPPSLPLFLPLPNFGLTSSQIQLSQNHHHLRAQSFVSTTSSAPAERGLSLSWQSSTQRFRLLFSSTTSTDCASPISAAHAGPRTPFSRPTVLDEEDKQDGWVVMQAQAF